MYSITIYSWIKNKTNKKLIQKIIKPQNKWTKIYDKLKECNNNKIIIDVVKRDRFLS